MKYGGKEALESYGLTVADEYDEKGWVRLRDLVSNTLTPSHLNFLKKLRLAFVWHRYLN
jgi:serine/threonine protein phosphatase 1